MDEVDADAVAYQRLNQFPHDLMMYIPTGDTIQ